MSYSTCVQCWWSQEEGSGSPRTDLQMVVSDHVVLGIELRVIWKNIQCSELLSHLSSPNLDHFLLLLSLECGDHRSAPPHALYGVCTQAARRALHQLTSLCSLGEGVASR